MTLLVVLEVLVVGTLLFNRYMTTGQRGERLSAQRLAGFRWSTRLGLGWAVIILVRLVTRTYT